MGISNAEQLQENVALIGRPELQEQDWVRIASKEFFNREEPAEGATTFRDVFMRKTYPVVSVIVLATSRNTAEISALVGIR